MDERVLTVHRVNQLLKYAPTPEEVCFIPILSLSLFLFLLGPSEATTT